MSPRSAEYAGAFACAILVALVAYSVARACQAVTGEPDPMLVSWSTRTALFWRLALCGYVVAFVAPAALPLVRRRGAEAVFDGLARALPWVALLFAAQALLLP